MAKRTNDLIHEKRILRIILVIRGENVILDSDLAALYGVETRRLNEPPQAKDMLQRQIEATDKRIDQLVYELYDLTNEEIKIVESET